MLYVLLPPEAQPGLPYFLVIYVGALVLGTLSHAPGGLGVFEATIIAAIGPDSQRRRDRGARPLPRRLLRPPLRGRRSLGLAAFEVARQRHILTAAAADTERILRPIVPYAAAALAFVAGLVLLFSGSLPGVPSRLHSLKQVVGLPLIETSHLIGSIAGVTLFDPRARPPSPLPKRLACDHGAPRRRCRRLAHQGRCARGGSHPRLGIAAASSSPSGPAFYREK